MNKNSALRFCLSIQLYFATISAIVLIVSVYLFGDHSREHFSLAAGIAALYGILVIGAKTSFVANKGLGTIGVLLIALLNAITAYRGALPLIANKSEAALPIIVIASQVCVVWFTAMTALICLFAVIRRRPNTDEPMPIPSTDDLDK